MYSPVQYQQRSSAVPTPQDPVQQGSAPSGGFNGRRVTSGGGDGIGYALKVIALGLLALGVAVGAAMVGIPLCAAIFGVKTTAAIVLGVAVAAFVGYKMVFDDPNPRTRH